MINIPLKELKKEIRFICLGNSHRFSYVRVLKKPEGWQCEGVGNSAAVFRHENYPDVAIKIFSDACTHVARQESAIYRQLGDSPFFPKFYGNGENFLLLQYLPGVSVYESLRKGIYIPKQILRDIENAISYARQRGLNLCNLHAKNILICKERGYLIDVSGYMKKGECHHWNILRYLYRHLYIRWYKPGMNIPFRVLESVRRGYRFLRLIGILKSSNKK